MNEKCKKNAKVEKMTKMLGMGDRTNVILPFIQVYEQHTSSIYRVFLDMLLLK